MTGDAAHGDSDQRVRRRVSHRGQVTSGMAAHDIRWTLTFPRQPHPSLGRPRLGRGGRMDEVELREFVRERYPRLVGAVALVDGRLRLGRGRRPGSDRAGVGTDRAW